jgi:hypothetical protein
LKLGLQFCQFLGWHVVRSLGDGGCAWLKFDDKLDISVGWDTPQFIGKNIRKLSNHWSFFHLRSDCHIRTRIDTIFERKV